MKSQNMPTYISSMSKYRCVDQLYTYSCDPGQMSYNNDNKQSVAYTILQMYNRVKCTKYETCALLHRFHILYISRECNSKTEQTCASPHPPPPPQYVHISFLNILVKYTQSPTSLYYIGQRHMQDTSDLTIIVERSQF